MHNISIIAAIGSNHEMGKDNDLLWKIPADLKRFMQITSGHTVVMGRRTFESIGSKPLKNRRNIIVTSRKSLNADNIIIVHSKEEAISLLDPTEETFILGGASIYKQFLPVTHKMYLTHVHKSYDADTFFPSFNPDEWEIIRKEDITGDEKAGIDYSFVDYIKI